MARMINAEAAKQKLRENGWPEAVEAFLDSEEDVVELIRCENCRWWQNPCYGYGAFGYCSDAEVKKC